MSDLLFVGDVHATPDDLDDCEALLTLVEKTASERGVGRIVFLGDQYHTHGIVRVEVMGFWSRWFERLSKNHKVTVVLGNHDRPNDSSISDHALRAHAHVVDVVDSPKVLGGVLYLPYYHDNEEFVKVCNEYPLTRTVVCHQTFDGGKYENGAYMADGVDQEKILQEMVISGHIHTPQSFGKVVYVGAPRWRSLADAAATSRSIRPADIEAGLVKLGAGVSTGGVCSKIIYAKITPDEPDVPKCNSKDRLYVDVHGNEGFVKSTKEALQGAGVRIRTFVETKRVAAIRESDGIPKAFEKYASRFEPPFGSDKETVKGVALARTTR